MHTVRMLVPTVVLVQAWKWNVIFWKSDSTNDPMEIDLSGQSFDQSEWVIQQFFLILNVITLQMTCRAKINQQCIVLTVNQPPVKNNFFALSRNLKSSSNSFT